MTSAIVASVIGVLVVGSVIALWWWRLVAKMAPYHDEVHRDKDGKRIDTGPEVEVISRSGPKQS